MKKPPFKTTYDGKFEDFGIITISTDCADKACYPQEIVRAPEEPYVSPPGTYKVKHKDPNAISIYEPWGEVWTWQQVFDEMWMRFTDEEKEIIDALDETTHRGVLIRFEDFDCDTLFHAYPPNFQRRSFTDGTMSAEDTAYWLSLRRATDQPELSDDMSEWDDWLCGDTFDIPRIIFQDIMAAKLKAELDAELPVGTAPKKGKRL